jgi:hypothetical protein
MSKNNDNLFLFITIVCFALMSLSAHWDMNRRLKSLEARPKPDTHIFYQYVVTDQEIINELNTPGKVVSKDSDIKRKEK